MFGYRPHDQNTKFWKFKMADDRHVENGLSQYLSQESSEFDEIWCADTNVDSKNGHVTKYQNFKIQNGWRPPYWKWLLATPQWFIVKLTWNLVWRSRITLRHRSHCKNTRLSFCLWVIVGLQICGCSDSWWVNQWWLPMLIVLQG